MDTYGAIEAQIDWSAEEMSCEGMRRPGNEGARLRFAGKAGEKSDARYLAFILSIPNLAAWAAGSELPTRVTLTEEDAGRFFSTRDADVCWSDIERHVSRENAGGNDASRIYSIAGLLYCVAPVAELNGTASATLSDLAFSCQLHWTADK